ncbi:unnamed protein product, partial [Ixodes pacificus]
EEGKRSYRSGPGQSGTEILALNWGSGNGRGETPLTSFLRLLMLAPPLPMMAPAFWTNQKSSSDLHHAETRRLRRRTSTARPPLLRGRLFGTSPSPRPSSLGSRLPPP